MYSQLTAAYTVMHCRPSSRADAIRIFGRRPSSAFTCWASAPSASASARCLPSPTQVHGLLLPAHLPHTLAVTRPLLHECCAVCPLVCVITLQPPQCILQLSMHEQPGCGDPDIRKAAASSAISSSVELVAVALQVIQCCQSSHQQRSPGWSPCLI